jgi:hypothetical protein
MNRVHIHKESTYMCTCRRRTGRLSSQRQVSELVLAQQPQLAAAPLVLLLLW